MVKHKIKLIGYIIMFGMILFGYGAVFRVMVESHSFFSITRFLIYFFAMYKATIGASDCVFDILKERAKSEDMTYERK